jgi:hypothetical protein
MGFKRRYLLAYRRLTKLAALRSLFVGGGRDSAAKLASSGGTTSSDGKS